MKVYLVNVLIDSCAWETLEVYKEEKKARERVNKLIKINPKRIFELCEMNLKC